MPPAARMFDQTSHPGFVAQGSPDVFVHSMPAARMGDKHVCMFPPLAGPHPPSTIIKGSATVSINHLPAARQMDSAGCGALILPGPTLVTVIIGD
jgi:uncharacterized Zn-binding protein involved in type VI secretion